MAFATGKHFFMFTNKHVLGQGEGSYFHVILLFRITEAVLTSTHNLCVQQKYENYQNFSSESFHFFVETFSINLNRRVFVMGIKQD